MEVCMIRDWIAFGFINFAFVMFVLSILISLIDWPIQAIRKRASVFEVIYRWVAFFALGITGIYTFLMHAFLPDYTAASIGWQTSPFQLEVAVADLAFGILGVISARASYGFKLATVIGATVWLWGDAVGHTYQIIVHHNFSIGNAGSWFWMDIIIPLVLIICILKLKNKILVLVPKKI
jgi:hypothetical protein